MDMANAVRTTSYTMLMVVLLASFLPGYSLATQNYADSDIVPFSVLCAIRTQHTDIKATGSSIVHYYLPNYLLRGH